MTLANEIVGAILVALGAAVFLLRCKSGEEIALKVLRCRQLDVVLMVVAAAWFLWIVANLGHADFGDYKVPLFIGFLGISTGAILWVPDFLGVRAASAIFMLASWHFLGAAFGRYDVPARLFMVGTVYAGLFAALYLAAVPYRARDLAMWLSARPSASAFAGAILAALGAWLMIVPALYY